MANTAVIPRAHIIYGICLPVAVLLGYLLAQPYDSGSVAVVILVFSILSIPVLLKWHHSILIFSINAPIMILIKGRPMLWCIMAVLSLMILVLNRSIGREVRFFRVKQLSFSMIFLAIVVMFTAYLNGGIHLSAMGGGEAAGGKRYLLIFCGIFVYFALSSVSISKKYVSIAVAIYFLSSLTGLVGYIAALAGPSFYFLVELFPIESAVGELNELSSGGGVLDQGFVRFGELGAIGIGLVCYLFAKFGVRGLLDITKPWRLLLLLLTVGDFLFSGFRSFLIFFGLLFSLMFYLEGLFKTRYLLVIALGGILSVAMIAPFTQKLPLAVQRTVAFIPLLDVDQSIRGNADASTEWRLQMWQEVAPTIPTYLIKGKGYAMDANDAYLVQVSMAMGYAKTYEMAIVAGDYHSGPLSVIVPFGIFGVAAIVWFMSMAIYVLRLNYLHGDPEFKQINTLLFCFFIVRLVMFIFIYGSLYSDLFLFTSLVGLSVSINGGIRRPRTLTSEEKLLLVPENLALEA